MTNENGKTDHFFCWCAFVLNVNMSKSDFV